MAIFAWGLHMWKSQRWGLLPPHLLPLLFTETIFFYNLFWKKVWISAIDWSNPMPTEPYIPMQYECTPCRTVQCIHKLPCTAFSLSFFASLRPAAACWGKRLFDTCSRVSERGGGGRGLVKLCLKYSSYSPLALATRDSWNVPIRIFHDHDISGSTYVQQFGIAIVWKKISLKMLL